MPSVVVEWTSSSPKTAPRLTPAYPNRVQFSNSLRSCFSTRTNNFGSTYLSVNWTHDLSLQNIYLPPKMSYWENSVPVAKGNTICYKILVGVEPTIFLSKNVCPIIRQMFDRQHCCMYTWWLLYFLSLEQVPSLQLISEAYFFVVILISKQDVVAN